MKIEWNSCKDKSFTPPLKKWVLVTVRDIKTPVIIVSMGKWNGVYWKGILHCLDSAWEEDFLAGDMYFHDEVTHWAHLPEPCYD